jgi:hypothetical protein
MIPYGKQYITQEDIDAVINALKSDYLTQGPLVNEFERQFASYVGAKYAVAVANGTAALHLSAMALNLKPGDKVITTPITFAASANCIRYCNGEVVFSDIDPDSFLLDIGKVRKLLEQSPIGTYKGIIPVDFAGRPVNLEKFKELADEFGLWIIEDACHAPGGYFIDKMGEKQFCGNGKFADLAIFSFHPVKHIACGEGGMITTNNETLYEKLLMLRTHGITKNNTRFRNSIEFSGGDMKIGYPGWYMEMQELGYNYRLSDIHAALGISQLKRANEGLKTRREIALRYDKAFYNHPNIVSLQLETRKKSDISHAYHLYIILTSERYKLYNFLIKNQVFPQVHYIPTHTMPYYKKLGFREGDFPIAEDYYKQCLSLPMYPSLNIEEQEKVIEFIMNFFKSDAETGK